MRIPFTNYHIVKETQDEFMGRDELIEALGEARKGHNSYGRRLSLRKAMRAAYNLKVVNGKSV